MFVTLTTDFGNGSSYVAALKGALLTVNPSAQILDLTHEIPAQDVLATSCFLTASLPWFPPHFVHVVVVDPGVGTDRALLCVEWRGSYLLVPDNGCWTSLVGHDDPAPVVRHLTERRFWRHPVSPTFHGRDILAPVAGHISLGTLPNELGPAVTDWVQLAIARPTRTDSGIRGEVITVDRFGNLITNVPSSLFEPGSSVRLTGTEPVPFVRTYGDAEPGTVVALIGSSGLLEVAVVNGSAAARLGLKLGAIVEVRFPT